MVEKISIGIQLEGGEEMQRQFAAATSSISKLGNTAEQAFAGAASAAQKFSASTAELGRVEGVIRALAARARDSSVSFSELAKNYDAARQSAASYVPAAEKAAQATAKVAQETKKMGISATGARAAVNAVAQGLNVMGAGPTGRFATAFANIGTRLGPVGIAITAIGAAAAGATGGMSHFADAAKETATTLGELAAAGATSFEFMSSLQIAFATGGTTLQKFAQELGNLQEKIAAVAVGLQDNLAASADRAAGASLNLEQAELALSEAQAKARSSTGQLSEAQQKLFDRKRRRLATEQAELAVAEAARKKREAEANNLEDLVEKYEALARGIPQTFDPLTTLESKAKAVTAALADIKDPERRFEKLADIFKNLSELDRAQLGKQLGLSPETIATLSRGSDAIRQMQADIERLGLALDELDKQNLSDLKNAQSEVGALWDALTQKMGALAAPAFTSFWEGLAARIRELAPEFIKLGEAFGRIDFKALGKAVGDFALWLAKVGIQIAELFASLAEGDFSALDKFFADLAEKIVAALTTIGEIAGGLLSGIMKTAFSTGADDVTKNLSGKLSDSLANVNIPEDKLKSAATRAGEAFGEAFANAVKSKVSSTGASLLPTTEDIVRDFAKFGQSVVQNWEILKRKLSGGLFGLISPAGAAEAGGGQLGGADFGPMIAGAEVAAVRIKQIFADAFAPPATVDFSGIITAAQTAATDIGTVFSQIDIASALSAQIDALILKFGELARAAAAGARGAMVPAGAGGGGGGGFPEEARGGLFGGRGTGTSDSNLAWVSRGEYITPARAVRQPGVLALLEALRRSGGNLRGILDDMGHFARGGLVARPAMAFAGGGMVGGGHLGTLTLGLPSGGSVSVRASASVVDTLQREAALAQVRSGGRKPSRYS